MWRVPSGAEKCSEQWAMETAAEEARVDHDDSHVGNSSKEVGMGFARHAKFGSYLKCCSKIMSNLKW